MTDAQVEAAAKCLHKLIYGTDWDKAIPLVRVAQLNRARQILKAAEEA